MSALQQEKKMEKYRYEDLAQVLEKAKTGDEGSVVQLMDQLYPLIKGTIKKYYFGKLDLEEVMQEAYMVLMGCLKDYDSQRQVPFLAFAQSRLRFHLMDLGRDETKQVHVSLNQPLDESEEGEEWLDKIPDEGISADQRLMDQGDHKILLVCWQTLTEREQEVLGLHFIEGHNLVEVSKILGLAYRTVVNTKVRGLDKLRKAWLAN